MPKSKKPKKVTAEEIQKDDQKDVINTNIELSHDLRIIEGKVKDGYCQYVYESLSNGDRVSVQGKGIVDKDLLSALAKFNAHLACIDDMFKHAGIVMNNKNIDNYHAHELTLLYEVTGISIKGNPENESVIIHGTKFVSTAGGRIEIKTPKIPLTGSSSYPWHNELADAVQVCRDEVDLYKNGKCTYEEEEEIVADNQIGMFDNADDEKEPFVAEEDEINDEFSNAKV